jgi:hypothetical protein
MKITREEFKEMVALHEMVNQKWEDAAPYINTEFLDDVVYPVFSWLEKCLKIGYDDLGESMLWLLSEDGAAISGDLNEETGFYDNVELSKDLDIIYDIYLKEVADESIRGTEGSSC